MSSDNFGIAVHGGAGVMKNLSEEQKQKIENKISDTLIKAYTILEKGGSSIDAVEFAVAELEDSPLFNAGKGSVYNSNGVQEMDASIMSGKDRMAGAVASIQRIKNPIKLARKVAESTEHVMLVGEGAEIFAKNIGETIVDQNYFYSEKNLKRLKKAKAKKNAGIQSATQDKIGTVGAVALDINGNISAATSTGGMTNKMPGRVGDSPIIGSGTWAQNGVCGVSSTGHGEYFIKYQVAREVCARIEYLDKNISTSSKEILNELKNIDAEGGLIAIDSEANIAMPFNTDGMIRGSITSKSTLNVAIY
ncbi:isoaspartyl peptidase/L-asparaginase [Gammaproteobacteria bacterium]|nr:isoaspartyl peptidase/L-asparaginase [Gammaproteobacteria bacterium]